MEKPAPIECLNCGHKVTSNFCANCGQSAAVKRLKMPEILGAFFQNAFFFDGRLLQTIIKLFKQPGVVAREFIEGKRVQYTNPFALYLLLSGLSIALFKIGNIDMLGLIMENPEMQNMGNPEITQAYLKFTGTVFENMKAVTALFIIPMPFILRLFFKQNTVAELFVFVMYCYSLSSIIMMPFLHIVIYIHNNYDVNTMLLMNISNLLMPLLFVWGIIGFRKNNYLKNSIKVALGAIINLFLFLLIFMLSFATYLIILIKNGTINM